MRSRINISKKTLVIIFCILMAIAVGLTVAIIVVSINSNTESSQSADDSDASESGDTDSGDKKEEVINGEGSIKDSPVSTNDGEEEGGSDSSSTDWKNTEMQAEIQNLIALKTTAIDELKDASFEEAMEYLDSRIQNSSDIDEIFTYQMLKVNIYYNLGQYEDALAEANKITYLDDVNDWNKKTYYNKMRWIYDKLGNSEKVQEYYDLWLQKNTEINGEAIGIDGEN